MTPLTRLQTKLLHAARVSVHLSSDYQAYFPI
jgi:hypothetical protein